jgi:hypothetical protein
MPCLIDYSCPDTSITVKVTWSAPAGPVSGYRLYYTPGSVNLCTNVWTAKGAPKLIAKLRATARSWNGFLADANVGGKYSVVAYNAAGSSKAAMTGWVMPVDAIVCG